MIRECVRCGDEFEAVSAVILNEFPYVWFWRQKPGYDRGSMPRVFDRERKRERCRVICRSRRGDPWTDGFGGSLPGKEMNSALLEFEDGYRTVTSRNGLRRAR